MGVSNGISKAFNVIFLMILVVIVFYAIFSFTQTLYIENFSEKNLVKDATIISELQESITIYYDYIYYGQYEKANQCTAILSRKEGYKFDKINARIRNYGEYVVMVKYAYKLYGNTYRCYVLTYDKMNSDLSYITELDKEKMDKIELSLDRVNNNFTIITDEYPGI